MTTASRSTTKLPANGSRALSVRIPDEQWHHLVAQAHLRGVSIAEAARQAFERDLDAQPDLGHEDGSPGSSMSYRSMLGAVDFAQLEELQADEDDASS